MLERDRFFYRELGRKLEAKRKACGIAQLDLARQLGIHRNTVLRWESGETAPDAYMLVRIAILLSTHLLALLPDIRHITIQVSAEIKPMPRRWHKKTVQAERDPALTNEEQRWG